MANHRNTVEDLFQKFVVIDETTGCWLWTGTKDPGGYGRAYYENGLQLAHGVFFEAIHGWRPRRGSGLVLDHEVCDTPSCVNPGHLSVTTIGGNLARSLRGRHASACRVGHPFDERWRRYGRCYPCQLIAGRDFKRAARAAERS